MALDCDDAILTLLDAPAVEDRPTVRIGHTTTGGREIAGARVVLRSDHPVAAWADVLRHPERADEWLPEAVGTKQVERLDFTHMYQRSDISFLFGAAHLRQQAIIGLHWGVDTATHFQNCWYAADPAPYRATVQPWDDHTDYLDLGYGAWDIRDAGDGHTVVSYQLWATAKLLPAQVTAWVLSQGLPDILVAYEAHVGQIAPR